MQLAPYSSVYVPIQPKMGKITLDFAAENFKGFTHEVDLLDLTLTDEDKALKPVPESPDSFRIAITNTPAPCSKVEVRWRTEGQKEYKNGKPFDKKALWPLIKKALKDNTDKSNSSENYLIDHVRPPIKPGQPMPAYPHVTVGTYHSPNNLSAARTIFKKLAGWMV